jgi:hypothetical protein
LSGIAAAVTALLGAPLAAAFFASEVMYRNRPLLEKLFYSLIAAVTAQAMSSLITGSRPMMFAVENIVYPTFGDMRYWAAVVLMGVAIAFVGQLYRILNLQFHAWFQKGIKNRFVRLLVGFGITGVITLIVYYLTRLLQRPIRAQNVNNSRYSRLDLGSKAHCSHPGHFECRAKRNRLGFGERGISDRPLPKAGPSVGAGIVPEPILQR